MSVRALLTALVAGVVLLGLPRFLGEHHMHVIIQILLLSLIHI